MGTDFRSILGPHPPYTILAILVGHPVSPKCFTIVDREVQVVTRKIKKAIYIHVNYPSLNRNLGKYKLPHIWDEVLQDTPSLQLK